VREIQTRNSSWSGGILKERDREGNKREEREVRDTVMPNYVTAPSTSVKPDTVVSPFPWCS